MPKVRDRARHPGSGEALARRAPEHLAAVMRGPRTARSQDRVGAESYVIDERTYCVYMGPDEQVVREHAKQGGFPANRVSRVRTVIEPTTAED
jgi:Protein of unknown function (DUF4242)